VQAPSLSASVLVAATLVLGCGPRPERYVDADQDGVVTPFDCDDSTPNRGLGPEIPYDGIDNDCDLRTPDDDRDGDGVPLADDCDDEDPRGHRLGVRTGDIVARPGSRPCAGYCELEVEGGIEHREVRDSDLQRYHCIVSVDEWLYIGDAPSLTSLDGLERLVDVGDALMIMGLPGLGSLDPLSGLQRVGTTLWVEDNDQLASLSGLEGVGSVPLVRVVGNDSLSSLRGLAGLRVTRGLTVGRNPLVESLDGIVVAPTLDLGLTLVGNASLHDLSALRGLEHASHLTVFDSSLVDLVGLDDLETVGGDLRLSDNAELTSLDGLGSVREVEGDLVILANPALRDLSALSGLVRVGGDVRIRDNPSLPWGAIQQLVDGIEAIGGRLDVPSEG